MDLHFEFYIQASPDRVWEVLTADEEVKKAYFGCILRSTLEDGSEYAYVGPGREGDHTVHVYGTILACEAGRLLSMTDHPGPCYRENHAELGTRVTYSLEQVGSSTKLTLVHDGWPSGHPAYEHTKGTWPMILSNMKTIAETGQSMDFGWQTP